jgi:hypothetical protein
MAVLHRDGSNRTPDETCPDYSYFHVNAFLGIALICIFLMTWWLFLSVWLGSALPRATILQISGIDTLCLSRQKPAIDRQEVLRGDSGGKNCNLGRHRRPFFQFINPPAM